MPPELRDLMIRYSQLARLLPQDACDVVAEQDMVRLVLAEMELVKAKMDAFIAAAGKPT
jgi:hypothetical protein